MGLSVGVLIIGSLYWEPDRQQWRDTRLRMNDAVDVSAPIRYGRISERRGNTYTMVFSRRCAPGQAKAVPCQDEVLTAADLAAEAEHLWAAEHMQQRNGRISAAWGCVTLLANPHRHIPAEILNGWAARVRTEQHYGNIGQAQGEGVLVDGSGMLQISWPTLVADNALVPLDLLLATATQPSLTGEPRSYAAPETIAAAWRNDRKDNVRYFRNNMRDGIRTFEDEVIRASLEAKPTAEGK